MNKLLKLQQARATAIDAAKAILADADASDREMTDDEQKLLQDHKADADRLAEEIKAEEAHQATIQAIRDAHQDLDVPDVP